MFMLIINTIQSCTQQTLMEQHYNNQQSKQFTRHVSIEPITRTTSYGVDLRRKSPKPVKIKLRQSGQQNNYNLASIVQEILAMKPKTAGNNQHKRNQVKQKARVETIGNQCLKPDFGDKKAQPINLLNILRGKRQLCIDENNCNRKDEDGYKLLQIDSRSKQNLNRNATSRTKNYGESEQVINFETISYPEVRRKSQNKERSTKIFKVNSIQLDEDGEEEKNIKKQLTDKVFVPKTKLTIKNIDKIMIQQNKHKPPKQRLSLKYDIKKPESKPQSRNISIDKDKTRDFMQTAGGERKSRKNIIDEKIPEFIKASLENYKHESDFVINYTKVNKVPQTAPVQNHPIPEPQVPYCQKETLAKQVSEDNLAGAKFKLCQKQKRRTTRIGDYIRSKKEEEDIEQPEQQNLKRKTFKQKSKKKRFEEDKIQQICGWQQYDLPIDNFDQKY